MAGVITTIIGATVTAVTAIGAGAIVTTAGVTIITVAGATAGKRRSVDASDHRFAGIGRVVAKVVRSPQD